MSCSVGPLHFKCVSLYPLENHSDLVETEKQEQSVGINRTWKITKITILNG